MIKENYNNWWKSFDMNQTGLLCEKCSDIIYDIYKKYIHIPAFIEYYFNSEIRYFIDIHHPRLSTISNTETIKLIIDNDFNGNIPEYMTSDYDESGDYKSNELYWLGWFFIYCLYTNKDINSSKELYKILNFNELIKLYPTFHEMDNQNCYNKIF